MSSSLFSVRKLTQLKWKEIDGKASKTREKNVLGFQTSRSGIVSFRFSHVYSPLFCCVIGMKGEYYFRWEEVEEEKKG